MDGTACRTGLCLSVVLAARRRDLSAQRWHTLETGVWGSGELSSRAASSTGGPRWAVRLADGREVSTADPSRRGPDGRPKGPVLVETGSTGSGSESQVDLWLWPLPGPEQGSGRQPDVQPAVERLGADVRSAGGRVCRRS